MSNITVILISLMLLFVVFRKAYYRNKSEPPKEFGIALFLFLIGAYLVYEASQDQTMYTRVDEIYTWQIGLGGIVFIIVALYFLRTGINKKEKMKMEDYYSRIDRKNFRE
jgi:hypothetical protein